MTVTVAAGIFVDRQVEQVGLGDSEARGDVVRDSLGVHDVNHGVAPSAGTGGFEVDVIILRVGRIFFEPNDNCLAAAVEIKITHGVTHRIIHISPPNCRSKSPKLLIVIGSLVGPRGARPQKR